MRLRPAKEEDAAAVTECVHAAYRHYVERIGRAPAPMSDDYGKAICEGRVTVVESSRRIVGVLVLGAVNAEFLLENIAVQPSEQGKGVGGALITNAEAEARRRGFASICLYTNEKMTENLAWYAKLGYAEFDRRTENGLRRVYMRKRLK